MEDKQPKKDKDEMTAEKLWKLCGTALNTIQSKLLFFWRKWKVIPKEMAPRLLSERKPLPKLRASFRTQANP